MIYASKYPPTQSLYFYQDEWPSQKIYLSDKSTYLTENQVVFFLKKSEDMHFESQDIKRKLVFGRKREKSLKMNLIKKEFIRATK